MNVLVMETLISVVVKVFKLRVLAGNWSGKKVCVFHELGNKIELGVWEALYPLRRFSGGPGGKALKNITICSLQLV